MSRQAWIVVGAVVAVVAVVTLVWAVRLLLRLFAVRRVLYSMGAKVKLVFWGSPNRVADQILAFREEVGDFGTLLLAGKDWKDRELGRRNMQLLAEKVLPQVNAAIGKSKVAAE